MIRAIRYLRLQFGKHPSWDDHADSLAICRDEAGSDGIAPVDELDIDQFADSHSRRNGLFIRHGWLPPCRTDIMYSKYHTSRGREIGGDDGLSETAGGLCREKLL